eukprot:scaffold229_cov157-Skeletonema_menzelii.AAC.2
MGPTFMGFPPFGSKAKCSRNFTNHPDLSSTVGPPILPAVSIARPWILPVSEADHTLLVSLASPLRAASHTMSMTMTMTLVPP